MGVKQINQAQRGVTSKHRWRHSATNNVPLVLLLPETQTFWA